MSAITAAAASGQGVAIRKLIEFINTNDVRNMAVEEWSRVSLFRFIKDVVVLGWIAGWLIGKSFDEVTDAVSEPGDKTKSLGRNLYERWMEMKSQQEVTRDDAINICRLSARFGKEFGASTILDTINSANLTGRFGEAVKHNTRIGLQLVSLSTSDIDVQCVARADVDLQYRLESGDTDGGNGTNNHNGPTEGYGGYHETPADQTGPGGLLGHI